MWLRSLADCDASCGAKAANLARLIAAGLPVPDGFVVEDHAFRFVAGELPRDPGELGHALERVAAQIAIEEAVPAQLVAEVSRRARELGTLAVRSSASLEDARTGSGAGVFASVTAVAPTDVWPAIRNVWASALAPLAATYARGREIAIAVVVQRFVRGDGLTVYTRPAGDPRGSKITVQRGDYVREYARDDVDPIVAIALRAEHAIGAAGGADVELVETRDGALWVVQARPIVHPPPRATRTPPPPALLAALVADGRRWTWDVAHNPDPLSPAQAGLVERVERAGIAPWSMRLCAGYLYTTPRTALPRIAISDRAELEARAAAIEARIGELLAGDLALADAIDRYLAFYAIWANELAPLIASVPRSHAAGARPSAVEATLLAAARGELAIDAALDRLAPLAPAWDVAVPTFGERPHVIRDAIARANRAADLAAAPDDLASAAADLAERDDLLFAQAQWLVRQALLATAAAHAVDPDDICWVSLDDAVAGRLDPDDVRRRAAAARAAHERAASWAMPLVIGGDGGDDRSPLRGFGSGARISGRVVRFASLASAAFVGRGDIIVTRAITPALAVFVVGCAGIISETGGPLDHGAAIARELGIPYVVGCRDATALLHDGMHVTIDGDGVQILDES